MARRRVVIGAVAGTLAVVTAAAVVVVVAPRLRGRQGTPPPVAPIAATLRLVTPAAVVGQEAELLAAAVSRTPVVRFELWSGGERVAEASPLVDGHRAAAVLRWAPGSAGTHLLVLRAVDDLGHAAHAAPIRMRTAEPPDQPATSGVAAFGTMAPHGPPVIRWGPAGGPARFFLGRAEIAPAPADPAAPRVTTVIEGCTLRINADAGPSLSTLALFTLAPGQPGFQSLRYGDTGHSEATLPLVAGDVAVYALGYGGPDSAASPILSVRPPAGCADQRWQGDVSIVDGLLVAPGPPDLAYLYLSIDGGQWQRAPAKDQTFIRRRNGVLDFSRVLPPLGAAERIDVEAWSHDGSGAYQIGTGTLVAGKGEEGFMPVLVGLLPGTDLDIVVKHVDPDLDKPYETLERYGEIHSYEEVNPPPNPNLPSPSITIPPLSGHQLEFPMRWKPKVPGITHGVWQVSTVPLSNAPLTAPGVLLSGTVPVTQLDFDLDFRPLVEPTLTLPVLDLEPASAGELKYQDYSAGVDYSALVPQSYEAAKAKGGFQVYTGGLEKAPGTKVALVPPKTSLYEFVQWLHPQYLYVRIVPMAGEQPVEAISNTVTFRLYLEDPTPYVPPPPPTVDVQVKFQRPYLPEAKYATCVRVVENTFATPADPGANPPDPSVVYDPYHAFDDKYKPAPVGTTVCPEKPSSDDDFDLLEFIEDAFGAAVDVWDAIVDAFNCIKQTTVNLIVDISGCGKSGTPLWFVDEDTCKDVAKLAVDATLMYFGIPPSLPDSGALYAAAKGQMTDLLYEWAASQGISCPPTTEEECKKQLEKMLDEVVKQAKGEISKSAQSSANSVGTLWLNHEIVVVPEPRGQLQPAIFTITFTRKLSATDDAAVPEKAYPGLSLQGVRQDWHWHDYDNKKDIENTTVAGQPLMGSGGLVKPVLLKELEPGESTTVVGVLDRPAVWFEPGADPLVKSSVNSTSLVSVHSDISHWYVLMMGGSMLTAYGGQYTGVKVDAWTTTEWGYQP